MNMFKISERLQQIAALITKGNVVADIGTDHAYLPIHIVKSGISNKVIAMDIRKGPLEKAQQNVRLYGVSDNISIRLSDGLVKLSPMEAETITICGMGGRLIQSILENGREKYDRHTQLILSPQSELREFRKYLYSFGYSVQREVMLKEDGQFYFIFCCYRDGQKKFEDFFCQGDDLYKETVLRYGIGLLKEKNECLREYLVRERSLIEQVYSKVNGLAVNNKTIDETALMNITSNEAVSMNIASDEELSVNVTAEDCSREAALKSRLRELELDIKCIERALEFY